jgi:hypothetical protein
MLEYIQYFGVCAALLSCAVWTRSATVRVMPLWHRALHVETSLGAIMEKQAKMNSLAALFAALAAVSQAAALFLRI